ncbi:MAG: Ig-like domain-containing protein, partial [Mycobacterium sp.]
MVTTLACVVLVTAVALGAFAVGKHTRSAGRRGQAGGAGKTAPPAIQPLTVVSTSPAAGATNIPSDQVVTVRLSSPVASDSGMPTFTPPVGGTWLKVGPTTISFAATAPFIPTSTETLTIPAGASGLRDTTGAVLAAPVSTSFTITQASTERLQQLLAQLGYLPLSYTPAAPIASPIEAATAQSGTFSWRWAGAPESLISLWTEGSENVITKGAVMNFENQHGLVVDGLAGHQVWTKLLADVSGATVDTNP